MVAEQIYFKLTETANFHLPVYIFTSKHVILFYMDNETLNIHLRSIHINIPENRSEVFPFSVPVIHEFKEFILDSPVTMLVGENGSGKSTFIEALAVACESIAAGGADLMSDMTLDHARELGKCFRLSWRKRNKVELLYKIAYSNSNKIISI